MTREASARAGCQLRFSADSFYRYGQFALAIICEELDDDQTAMQLYEKAAAQDLAVANWRLGDIYTQGSCIMEADPVQAVKYYKLAADQGSPGGLHNLGTCYEYGKGVTQNAAAATYYYQRADAANFYRNMHERYF